MAGNWNVLYKPYSAANSANPGGTSFLLPVGGDYQNVQIFGPNGDLQDTFKRSNYGQEHGVKFYSSKAGSAYSPNSQVRVTLGDGTTKNFNIGNTGGRYEGDFSSGSFNQVADPYSGGNGGGMPNFAPGQAGYGFYPGYLGNNYPSPFLSSYNAIDPAKYKYTDPLEFAKNYGEFNRGEVNKNFDQASQIALRTLDTELQGLQNFAPAAGALKRGEISLDNEFNQAQRTRQLDSAMPGVRGQLQGQASRAESYANGRAPDGVTDAALELGIRSDAADTASAGGFGSRSSTARNLANSMSADKRIQLSQYGDQLLSSNINQRSQLEMAPTEYSDAGGQIRTMPSVSASQLTQQNLGDLNNLTTMSVGNAFQSEIQQQQFKTNLVQGTNQFNASNELQNSQFNAGVQNTNSAGLFNYQAGYAGSVASAAQQDLNTRTALEQQARYQQIFSQYQDQAQDAGTTQSIAQGAAALPGAIGGGIAAINSISSALGYGNLFTPQNTAGVSDAGSAGGGGGSGVSTGGGYSVGDTSAGGVADGGFSTQEGYLNSGAGSLIANNTQTTNFPSVSDVPEGYVPVMSNADGSIGAVQQSALDNSANNFYSAMGMSSSELSSNPKIAASLAAVGGAVLQNAGVYASPGQGRVNIGSNNQGKPVYGDQAMMQNADPGVGQGFINTLTGVIDPFGALSAEDNGGLRAMGSVASDVGFLGQLTALQQNGDTKGFVNAAITRLGGSAVQNASSNPDTQDKLGTGFAAYQLYQNWDRMSPAQKSIGLATLGIQGYKTATGENLAQKAIIAADSVTGTPGLTVGDSLAMFGQGYNAYAVAKNWGQLNNFQKVTQGGGTAMQVAATAQQYGLLGAGTTGAAVPGVTAQGLAAAGWSTSPSLGVGAVTGAIDAAVPAGYTAVASSGGQVIAMPTSLVGTSAVGSTTGVATGTAATAGAEAAGSTTAAAGASSLGTTLAVAGGALGVAGGAYAVYKGWGQGGKEGAINGAIGGTAMAAGASAMLAAAGLALGPIGWAAIIGTSILGNAIQMRTGKSGDQQDRDTARRGFKENGSASSEDNWHLSLADGSKVNVGIDGHDGYHQARDYNVVKNEGKPLNVWDIDYSNDLDFVSGMGGMALSRIVNGGVSQGIDQFGGQLGNAALGNIGYGKDMTQGNFNKMAENQRAIYAQKGIKTKSDAFALANQAFADGRIDETQMISAHQSFNMIFDNDYKTATALMSGRNQGVGLMQNSGLIGNASSDAVKAVATKPAVQRLPSTGFQTQIRRPGDFASAQNPNYRPTNSRGRDIDPRFSSTSVVSPGFRAPPSYSYGNGASEYGRTPTLSRDAMIERNRARYQQAA